MQKLHIHRPFLKTLWQLWLVALFPLVIIVYCFITDIEFSRIDDGANYHKWLIFFIYLFCVAAWIMINRALAHSSFFRN